MTIINLLIIFINGKINHLDHIKTKIKSEFNKKEICQISEKMFEKYL